MLRADAVALIGLAAVRAVMVVVTGKSILQRDGVLVNHIAHGAMTGRRIVRARVVVDGVACDRCAGHMHLRSRICVARSVEDQGNAQQHA